MGWNNSFKTYDFSQNNDPNQKLSSEMDLASQNTYVRVFLNIFGRKTQSSTSSVASPVRRTGLGLETEIFSSTSIWRLVSFNASYVS